MGVPNAQSMTTRRVVPSAREAGCMEKRDLKENLIGYGHGWKVGRFAYGVGASMQANTQSALSLRLITSALRMSRSICAH